MIKKKFTTQETNAKVIPKKSPPKKSPSKKNVSKKSIKSSVKKTITKNPIKIKSAIKKKVASVKKVRFVLKEKPQNQTKLGTKYARIKTIGYEGREANVMEVKDDSGKTYAMKIYKPEISKQLMEKEVDVLKRLEARGITPKIIDHNLKERYIVMEKLDETLYDRINKNKGVLDDSIQKKMIKIFDILDEEKVFHGDASPLNFMFKKDKLYIIDFGFSKMITPAVIKELKTTKPNHEIMTLGFIIKVKDHIPITTMKTLLKCVPKDQLVKCGFI